MPLKHTLLFLTCCKAKLKKKKVYDQIKKKKKKKKKKSWVSQAFAKKLKNLSAIFYPFLRKVEMRIFLNSVFGPLSFCLIFVFVLAVTFFIFLLTVEKGPTIGLKSESTYLCARVMQTISIFLLA